MKREILPKDQEWFNLHQNLRCIPNEKLRRYGVIAYYHLPLNLEYAHFAGNFILLFDDNTLEDWSAPNVEALSLLLK